VISELKKVNNIYYKYEGNVFLKYKEIEAIYFTALEVLDL
jgi:hypothetical protein